MIKYYKLQIEKDEKLVDFSFNSIRFWRNKTDCQTPFPSYPEEDFFEICFKKKIKLIDITASNNKYIINIDNLSAEGIVTINYHNLNDVFDYFVIQIWNENNEYDRMWYFFYLEQTNFKINNVTKTNCECLFSLDQWMTFGSLFHDILKQENPYVKFLRKFKNRFIKNDK